MALIPTIQLCLTSTCDVLTFSETTGVYDVSTNQGGYGTPNPAIADFVSAVLTVTDPDGVEYEIDLFDDFPTSNTDATYTIDLADLGGRTSIEDGYWQFEYTLVDDEEEEYTATKSYFFYCQTRCCVNKLLARISTCETCLDDKVNNKKIMDYIKAKAFLGALENAAGCFNEDAFDNILSIINKICRNSDCTTCN